MKTVALLIRARSKLDPRWFDGDADRERAAVKMRSDPGMMAALRGEIPQGIRTSGVRPRDGTILSESES